MKNPADSEFVETAFNEADVGEALDEFAASALEKSCAFLDGVTAEPEKGQPQSIVSKANAYSSARLV